jgi:soluble lytic murein transglycosylase
MHHDASRCLPYRLALVAAAAMLATALVACDDGDDDNALSDASPEASATATTEPSPTATPQPDPGRAGELSYAGEFEAAIDAYADVVANSSGEERQRARFAQAQLLVRTGNDQAARTILESFLNDGGVSADAHPARFMHAGILERIGDATGALDSYQRHITAGGALHSYASAEQALILAGSGQIDAARVAGEATVNANVRPGYVARFALRLADAFAEAGADADALAWYARAREEGGDAAAALARGGAIKRRLGDPAWVSDYLTVIEGYPQSGVAVALLDELDQAGVPVSDYLRGHVEYRGRRDGAARASLTRAIAAGDNPADATYYIAAIDERAENFNAAIDGYAQVPVLNPASPLADNALWWRGRLLEGLGRHSEAATTFAQLVASYPASEWAGDARFHGGMALYRAGDAQAAAFAWAALAEGASDEERPKLLLWRGRAEKDAGIATADATLRSLIDAYPDDFYALRGEVLLGENDDSDREPDLDQDEADWDAIGEYIETQAGIALSPPATQTPDPRWATGESLEDAGLHDESVAVYLDIVNDHEGDTPQLYRTARRLDEEQRTSLAARAASRLISAIADAPGEPPDDLYRVAYPLAYGDLVEDASDGEDISPLLLLALVRQESFYDPQAGSSAGALGLTQVIEPTGRSIADVLEVDDFTLTDLYRPGLSLRFGANYISDQLDQFDGNIYHALAAYNGGPGTASNAIDTAGDDLDLFVEDLEFDETKLYVRLVMENYARYRHLYAGLDRPSLPE